MNTVRHLDLTVIMPVAPGANPKPAIKAIEQSIPKGTTAELITVTGTHPTRQRNLAAFRARGKILWFLDHDSIPKPVAARLLLREFRNHEVAVVGGPNLAAPARTPFERRAAEAIASFWGSPFVQDRYRSRGNVRPVGERSLILCNLMVRRESFLAVGGFDPRLYPNEENALMNLLAAAGHRLVHVPDAVVTKGRPSRVVELLREAFRYGRGRAEQMWAAPALSDFRFAIGSGLAGIGCIAGMLHPWYALAGLALLRLPVMRDITRLWVPSEVSVLRLAAYASGLWWGGMSGWFNRRLRLVSLAVSHSRSVFRSGHFRISESSSFDLGTITMKGAFRHA